MSFRLLESPLRLPVREDVEHGWIGHDSQASPAPDTDSDLVFRDQALAGADDDLFVIPAARASGRCDSGASTTSAPAQDQACAPRPLDRSSLASPVSYVFLRTGPSGEDEWVADQGENDVEMIKERTRYAQEEPLASTRMALRIAPEAAEAGDTGSTHDAEAPMTGRRRYRFEADENADEIRDELDIDMHGLVDIVDRMKLLAQAMGQDIDTQHCTLGMRTPKDRTAWRWTDDAPKLVTRNTERLKRY